MATTFSPSALFSSTSSAASKTQISPKTPHVSIPTTTTTNAKPLANAVTIAATAAAAAALVLTTGPPPTLAEPSFGVYYGTAASAANYGGYGGNSSKKDSAEYIYEVPEGWKERLVSKVEKGTNGTDSEFYNPKKRSEREYLTFLAGFPKLAPRDVVLNNLALSDVGLQDLISTADSVRSEDRTDEKGQLYYVYEIDGAGAHSLISVTCAKNKLYAHFVNAPTPEWNRDQETLKRIHESFKTVG
ncbi:hypothetical protein H6P81_018918 [Aristolochia fimbriata]|uniref:PsbP C-terminal domain-containing protein n=1 Tax=Aristolochia fimbriata TaxID=158543 RepID=A0AAV7E4G4_ARIFI|nr:hypothetical protein H6P81_018918 [Aristolochia fimbriata]